MSLTMFLPVPQAITEAASLENGRKMNLIDPEVIHRRVMHPVEGTLVEIKGVLDVAIDVSKLVIPKPVVPLSDEEIRAFVATKNLRCIVKMMRERGM